MPKLIFLGTSNALASESHENTHLLLVGQNRMVLIDCPNSPFIRFDKAGVDFGRLSDVILTHFHPDHVSGVPQLLMNMWLMNRTQPLNVYGLEYTLDRVEALMELYNWTSWPGFYQVNFHRLPEQPRAPVLQSEDFLILSSPMQHFIPSIGLQVIFTASGKNLVYSCDTEPCSQLIALAQGADVLIHEASGAMAGHTSAAQAGQAASLAGAASLYLIHYPTGKYAAGDLVAEARQHYEGPITLAEDAMELDFS